MEASKAPSTFMLVWSDARGALRSIHLAMFLSSTLLYLVWLSWAMRAERGLKETHACEEEAPGEAFRAATQVRLLATSVTLAVVGYVLSWFDDLFLENNTIPESRVALSTILRSAIQTAEVGSVFHVLVLLHMDRANRFNYARSDECELPVFALTRRGDVQFLAFYLLLATKAVKSVLSSTK